MKTKKEIKNFILKTLIPYKDNPDTCGYQNERCLYITNDGKKCALGKWLKKGPWQKSDETASATLDTYGQTILLKEARDMNFDNMVWTEIQTYHDCLAKGDNINWIVRYIEENLDIELPELINENEI